MLIRQNMCIFNILSDNVDPEGRHFRFETCTYVGKSWKFDLYVGSKITNDNQTKNLSKKLFFFWPFDLSY